MMRINLEVPAWIQEGLASGEFIRRGGVVYNRSGGIVLHLKETAESASNDDAEWSGAGSDDDGERGSELDAGLAVLSGLALVGLAVGAVATVAGSARNRRESRRELEWRIAEARRDSAHAAITSQRLSAPAGWYDDGSSQLRWWDGQDWTEHYYTAAPRIAAPAGWYDDGAGRQRWWDGQDWTSHYQGSQSRDDYSEWPTALGGANSRDLERGHEFPTISLSRAEWEEQVRVMMQARTISELQWRLLSNARVDGADAELLDWQRQLRSLTAREFSHYIDSYVAAQPERALELATAGWYDDGSGRERWWDGLEWTEYFQPVESRMLPGR